MNHREVSAHFSFIGLDDKYFNLQCISNGKCLFSETLSPKNIGQVSFDKRIFQDPVLVLFSAKPPVITTYSNTGGKILYPSSSKRKDSTTKLR